MDLLDVWIQECETRGCSGMEIVNGAFGVKEAVNCDTRDVGGVTQTTDYSIALIGGGLWII